MPTKHLSSQEKEFAAELLKERIYATFALVAVLMGINSSHTTPIQAEFIVAGTIISLWAASIVASIMSRRLIFRGAVDHHHEIRHQVRIHAPMLLTLVAPLLLMTLAAIHLLPLAWAIMISMISSILLLVSWSILSAKTLRANGLQTFILVVFQLAIGAGIILLKLAVGH